MTDARSSGSSSGSGGGEMALGLRPALSQELLQRGRAALWGLFIGDALAMPVHWYYDLRQLKRDFPEGIRGYEAPKKHLPGSILNLSSTGGGGRGSDKGHIIGDVINHGKRKYWLRGGDYHYHATLQKGENTLEAQLARVLMRDTVSNAGAFSAASWLRAFEGFMTTPGSHNDVYASTYIRMFFKNRVAGKPLEKCADNDSHNVDAMDALTLLAPVVLTESLPGHAASAAEAAAHAYLASTRSSALLPKYGTVFTKLFLRILERRADEPPQQALQTAATESARELGFDLRAAADRFKGTANPMTACYIDSSFPALLVFLYKYAHSPVEAVLASANAGGENVAQGAVLGALMGAAHGSDAWPEWCTKGLHSSLELQTEIEAFLSSVTTSAGRGNQGEQD